MVIRNSDQTPHYANLESSLAMSTSVVMLSGQYLPEVYGGAEQQCQRLASSLVELGVDVTVLTSRSKRCTPFEEERDGVRIIRPYTWWPPQRIGRYAAASAYWWWWARRWLFHHQQEYDVIHVHQCKFQAFVAVSVARQISLPVIVKLGNAGSHSDLASLRDKLLVGRMLYHRTVNRCTRFVAISGEIEADLRSHGIPPARIVRIPNGIDQNTSADSIDSARADARARLAPSCSHERILLFAGRLEPVKKVETLLRALARIGALPGARPLRLWLLGDGSQWAKLQTQVHELGIRDQVDFHGFVLDVRAYMLAADFQVSPSVADGMSNSLLEAMSVGLVPVSTPVSGAVDLIDDGRTGLLAAGGTVDDLAAVLQRAAALDDSELATIRRQVFELIQAEYRIERIADAYLELYGQVCYEAGPTLR